MTVIEVIRYIWNECHLQYMQRCKLKGGLAMKHHITLLSLSMPHKALINLIHGVHCFFVKCGTEVKSSHPPQQPCLPVYKHILGSSVCTF